MESEKHGRVPVIIPANSQDKTKSVEDVLGISLKRMGELSFIVVEDIIPCKTKAEALLAIGNRRDMTDIEKTYCGYKMYEYLLREKIPGFLQFALDAI